MIKPKIKVDVISDIVCPWCYIGKRRLERAVSQLSGRFDFELEYHPFELNPNMPQQGVNQRAYLSDKFGGEERYDQITEHTTDTAAKEGLLFNFAIQSISPNTRVIHAIINLAKGEDKQLKTVEAFFQAYFTKGIDLSQSNNLISVGESAGLAKDKIEECIDDNESRVQIQLAESEFAKLGITGVPFYIVNNKFGISGAQLSETFIKAFEETGAATEPEALSGQTCDTAEKTC